MTPSRPDADVIERRLRALRRTLTDLGQLGDVDAAALEADSIRRAAGERLVQVAVDLAVEINAHLVASITGEAPETARRSFELAGNAGIVPSDLAEQLAPVVGLRNILVHRYVDIDLEVVAASVPRLLDLLPRYVREVAAFVEGLDASPDEPPDR